MFLNSIFSFFIKKSTNLTNRKDLSHLKQVSFWVAGVGFENRKENIRLCRINETVKLVREPQNAFDNNAIHVKRISGESLGYVGKFKAAELATLLDKGIISSEARIIELKCNPIKDIFGVKISIYIEQEVYKKLSQRKVEIEYLINKSSRGNNYLLLECEESTLDKVIAILNSNAIETSRTGVSYLAGTDGKLYSWYVLLDDTTDLNTLEKVLRDNFPVLNERHDQEITQEYVNLQDQELDELKTNFNELVAISNKLISQNEKFKKRTALLEEQFQKVLDVSLPHVEFIYDSLDILFNEIKDFSSPLRHLLNISRDVQYKGKKVKLLKKWWELHFTTGQRDDGRIYFKREGQTITVLISFKKTQKKDIQKLMDFD